MQNNKKQLSIRFGGYTTAGVKPENQDAFAALQGTGQSREIKGAVACLADGVSCSDHSGQASQMLVSQFIEDYFSAPDTWRVNIAASKILSSLNTWLFHHGDQASVTRTNGFVATFASVVIKSNTVHLFHVGDSRIYRYRKGANKLVLLTKDHTQKRGSETLLTRAMGMDSHLEVDYKQEDVERNDIYIITTDGVHEFVTPAEMRQAVEASRDLEHTAQSIVEHALQSGSDDNASCLLLSVDNLPHASLDEVHRQLTQLTIPPVMDVGMSIDGYEVKRVIHSGTRSHLYLVQHPDHERPYVLKAPSENFTEDIQYLDGFIREQWVGSRINHDSVMKIFPTPQDSQFLYLLMEYIEGKTLRQWMHDNGAVPLGSMRTMVEGIVVAMRAFQRMDMIHRDLKPENIMVCDDGRIKIIDFGTVKVSGLSEIKSLVIEDIPVGSVDYIAPEYLLNGGDTFQSDIFSLGVMIYEMLSGQLPFNMSHIHRRLPKDYREWKYQSICEKNKSIPSWIDMAIKKATHPSVGQRYMALSELLVDLSKPNHTLLENHHKAPLVERSPIFVWQLLSVILFVIILVQWFLFFR